ncbi:MAG: S-layer homology domain-containing protein [Ruminococcaceae bacterium]|nr:S-layer homology domain-containing protein [Oscillospiraceae bacterium]
MKNIKRILSGVLAAAMISASASFISAAPVTFTDVDQHWAKSYITYLVEKDVLNGYKQDDGTYMFKPEDTVTRAEFIKMMDETFGLTETANISGKYNDVKPEDWYYEYFAKAVAQGYIHNYGNTATPNGALSREEATSLLVRYLDLSDEETLPASTFTDYAKISSYYSRDVLKAAKANLINGYKENDGTSTFRPQNTLTRAEALTILYRAAGAIFTGDRSSTDTAAHSNNAVIKASANITLANQVLEGRVIVSEGTDTGTVFFKQSKINDTLYIRGGANVTLDSTTAKTVVIDSPDIISFTVQNNSSIENLIINERCSIMLGSGTSVEKLTTDADANLVTINGTGIIKNAYINSQSFSSTMVPHNFEIFDGIIATFASKDYQGSSTAQKAFVNTPFMTVEDEVHCLNVLAEENGSIRYYFTTSPYCPGISDFDGFYFAAAYKSSFDVRANTSEKEYTYNTSYVKSFGYIVLQLEANGRYFPPVIIPNTDASGTGFTTDPVLKDEKTISYSTSTQGTVYYMYATEGTNMNINDFVLAYSEQSGSLKGETNNRSGNIVINATYAEVNNYMIFMFKSADGLYYTPVVVALGNDGFSKDPVVVTPGLIEFTPSVTGTIYYYYSLTSDLPAPDKFNSEWRYADISDSDPVTKGKKGSISYTTKDAEKYPYLILCLNSNNSDYMLPVAVKIDYDSGFAELPEVVNTTIRFESSVSGKLKYYYSNVQQAPSAAEFAEAYTKASYKLKGEIRVTVNDFDTFDYDPATAALYSYMVIMIEDSTGEDYQPVVVNLLTTADTGFSVAPYIYGDSIYFKTNYDCNVWFFYSRTDDAVPASDFYERWDKSNYGYHINASKGNLKTIEIEEDLIRQYPYIVFSTSRDASSEIFTYPVLLDIEKDAEKNSDTGLKVTSVSQTSITINSEVLTEIEIDLTAYSDGRIYYYATNESTIPSASAFDDKYFAVDNAYRGSVSASDGQEEITVRLTSRYRYVVLRLEGSDANNKAVYYTAIVIDTLDKNLPTDSGSSDIPYDPTLGTTARTYGFEIKDINPTKRLLTILPTYSGTVTVTLATEDMSLVLSQNEYVVREGSEIDIPYTNGSGTIGGLTLYLFLQLTDDEETTYVRYGGIEMVP